LAATVAEIGEALFHIAAAGGNECAARFLRVLRNDIDDAVDCVWPPDGAAGAADDLDAIDVFEQGVLHLPVSACEEGAVDGAAVDQDEDGAGEPAAESANADRPFVAIDAGDFDAGRKAQRLGDFRDTGAADVFARDDVDRGGGLHGFDRLP